MFFFVSNILDLAKMDLGENDAIRLFDIYFYNSVKCPYTTLDTIYSACERNFTLFQTLQHNKFSPIGSDKLNNLYDKYKINIRDIVSQTIGNRNSLDKFNLSEITCNNANSYNPIINIIGYNVLSENQINCILQLSKRNNHVKLHEIVILRLLLMQKIYKSNVNRILIPDILTMNGLLNKLKISMDYNPLIDQDMRNYFTDKIDNRQMFL